MAMLSGVLFALSLPPYNCALLGWFCVVPLLIAANGKRSLIAMGLGLVAALSAGVVQAGWRGETMSLFFAYYPFMLLAPILALIVEVASANRRRLSGLAWTTLVAAFGVICEWLTRFLPMPIHLALTQYRSTCLIQIASITGIWGVSFLLWWSNAALADWALRARPALKRRPEPESPVNGAENRLPVPWPVIVGLTLVASALAFGAIALHRPTSADSIDAAAIQDYSGGGDGLSDEGDSEPQPDREDMTKTAAATGAKFIVWSEECLASGFSPTSTSNSTRDLARKLGVYLTAGYGGSERPKPYNSAVLITPDGDVAGVHHKIMLYAEEKRTTRAGTVATAFPTALGRVGVEICFDTCGTSVTRRETLAGARLIAVPTNDPVVVRGIMHNLHSTLMPFRAVENGVPMVRDDSDGRSEVIDGHGRILAIGPLYASAIVDAVVPLGSGEGTLFTRLGDWFAYACILYFVVVLVYGSAQKTSGQETL